jgi:transcriptional antiterminator RfaH
VAQLRRRIANIQAAGGLVFADLATGDAVEITAGPFAGYEAIFDLRLKGSDRVRVLLDLLRRQVPLELDAGSIRKLRAGNMVKSGRTRR